MIVFFKYMKLYLMPMVQETGVQSLAVSYQSLKNGTWCRLA